MGCCVVLCFMSRRQSPEMGSVDMAFERTFTRMGMPCIGPLTWPDFLSWSKVRA